MVAGETTKPRRGVIPEMAKKKATKKKATKKAAKKKARRKKKAAK